MSNNGPYKKEFSLTDIQNYIDGKLSAVEMHAIEAAALDDPFLADAIEGFENNKIEKEIINQDISTLRKKLADYNHSSKKAVPLFTKSLLWKAAAVLLISAGMLALTYMFRDKPGKETLASVKFKPAPDSTVPASAPLTALMDSQQLKEEDKTTKPGIVSAKKTKKIIADPETASPSLALPKKAEVADSIFPQARNEVPAHQLPETKAAESLSGKVAGVEIKKKDQSLDEVVVSGYGLSKARSHTYLQPYPAGGMENFNEYILNNKNPDSVTNGNGQLMLVFYVSKNGRLSDFEIQKSLNPSRDKEAVELIKSGPKWINPSKKKQKVNLVIKF